MGFALLDTTGFAGIGGAATGDVGLATTAGAAVTEPPDAFASRIFASISAGESFGPVTIPGVFGAALSEGDAAAEIVALAATVVAGLAPPPRMAAMISFVDDGAAPGGDFAGAEAVAAAT